MTYYDKGTGQSLYLAQGWGCFVKLSIIIMYPPPLIEGMK